MNDFPHVTHITVVAGYLSNYPQVNWMVIILDPYLMTGFMSIRQMYEHLREKSYLDGEFMMTIKYSPHDVINLTHENVEEQMALAYLTLT